MRETKIGIVEDEIIIADSIRSVLLDLQYTVPEPCADYNEAISMLHTEQPDLVLLDINLAGHELDGISVARYIRTHFHMPFIFLTANSDAITLSRAKSVSPNAFLVKPFARDELYAAIEIAMHNFYESPSLSQNKPNADSIFIKEGNHLHKVLYDDILYIESDHVYVSIHTPGRRYLVRTSLQNYAEKLKDGQFVRIHRGFIVNRKKITRLSPTNVFIGEKELPVSRKYRDLLLEGL